MKNGQIIILNGAPRSGKSSIVKVIQDTWEGAWLNLGADAYVKQITPPKLLPGIGLRPGGERQDLEPFIVACYRALYESIAIHSKLGLNVVADTGHHDCYSKPLFILSDCAKRLYGFPVIFVGVKCSIDAIMDRRRQSAPDERALYLTGSPADPVPPQVLLWQKKVHEPDIYDIEVDTTLLGPAGCAGIIKEYLSAPRVRASAFERLAEL